MKTKTIDLYEFDELPDDVKARVLDKNRYINTDYEWHDFLLDDWKEKLEGLGFEDPTISFSGFGSQGDGASFTCKSVDIEKFLTVQKKKGQFKDLLKGIRNASIGVNVEVVRISHHCSHEYTVRAEVEVLPSQDGPFANACYVEGDKLQNLITSFVVDTSREIYKELETEFFCLISDEAVTETIKANEYTFRANGTMENS